MSELDNLLRRHAVWTRHLEKVCDEIGSGELEYHPAPESNSVAWIVLHLISGYREFIELSGPERAEELLGDMPLPRESELAGMPLSRVMAFVDAHREAYMRQVERLRESDRLESVCPAGEGKNWLDLIYAVQMHEVYHCGQLAYLAKLLQQKAKDAREG